MRGPRSTGSGRSARVAAAALVAFVAVAVAGCGLLFPGPMGPNDGMPSPIATFTKGHATLDFADGTSIELGALSHGPHIYSQMGTVVRWSNDDGWSVGLTGAGGDPLFGGGGELMIDHIADHKHLTALGDGRCIVTAKTADKSGISGTATCRGLNWIDIAAAGMFDPFASPPPSNGPGFDLDVTFEATP